MPIHKTKHSHTKVYRPNGMRYSEGKANTISDAIDIAYGSWVREFGNIPRQEETVIEIVGITGQWIVTINEVIDRE